jgi:hypothetical protein
MKDAVNRHGAIEILIEDCIRKSSNQSPDDNLCGLFPHVRQSCLIFACEPAFFEKRQWPFFVFRLLLFEDGLAMGAIIV